MHASVWILSNIFQLLRMLHELMGVIANVQGIMIVNRSLNWISYTDCNVTSVGHACLFTAYSHMLVLISVIVT